MNKKIVAALAGTALAAAVLAGCGPKSVSEGPAGTGEPAAEEPAATAEEPTKDEPIIVDEEGRKVLVYAEVNRKYVTEPTRHGVVCSDGGNCEKAVFRAGGNALDFHDALVSLGGKPGDNVKKDSPPDTKAEGDALDITVSWVGGSYPLNDLIVSTGELGGRALEPRFGGNREMQSKAKTGCIFCLDSCAAGITSNAAVGWMCFEEKKVEFRGDGDKLPPDGTPVTVTFALR